MKTLVTGGSGFIGSHLVDSLIKRGNQVRILDKKEPKFGLFNEATFFCGDITRKEDVATAAIDVEMIFHLAGLLGTHELVEQAYEAVRVNVGGCIRLLDYCRESGARLVVISKPNHWLNPYTIVKKAVEDLALFYYKEFNTQVTIVRWFNVYGSRQLLFQNVGYRKAIPTWIVSSLLGETMEIYGDGEQMMDLIHTIDATDAVLAVVDNWSKCSGSILEAGSGKRISVNDSVSMIKEIIGSKSEIKHIPMRPGEDPGAKIMADLSEITSRTGWIPNVDLEKGLEETITWYRKNLTLLL